ncbi:MAG: hypothetical protein IPM29_31435 [Planctomycetes bacterium]|nr:hypothetical protein [Planctomycetota bacterium]
MPSVSPRRAVERAPSRRAACLALLLAAVLSGRAAAQNCSNTSVGITPLDAVAASYRGLAGGLWGAGTNDVPAAHAAAGLAAAAAVQPLDANGQPATDGRIVLLSIGMSNTTQEFSAWLPISNADPNRNPAVVLVDGAQGGQDARTIANPAAAFWGNVAQRLANAQVTAAQVQAVWLKEAIAGPNAGWPAATQELQQLLTTICQILKQSYPNLRLCYLSSRIYAGYATSGLNPEPYAFESGFAVRWLLEAQVAGDPALNFDPARGPVRAAWLGWGPYTWADGLLPRADGLVWECGDFAADGTHPSASGRQKVAAMLDRHFTTDPTCVPWYLGGGGVPAAAIALYGAGCPGGSGPLEVRWNSLPFLGNAAFGFGVARARPNAAAVLFLAGARASIPLDTTCTLLVEPTALWDAIPFQTNANGAAILRSAVPSDPGLAGATVPTQWLVHDPQAPGLALIGGGALSAGAEWRVGR